MGFTVREAVNGQEAVELHASWQPHLIWMDMRMPVMDGYEATQQIKATPQGQATAIIALMAAAFEENRAAVLAAGCDDFVRKPFLETEIFDKMAKHLGVCYLYEENRHAIADREQVDKEEVALTPADLAVLPATWIAELRRAAMAGESKVILSLLEQLAPEHAWLIGALTKLVNEFRFNKLVGLTEQKTN